VRETEAQVHLEEQHVERGSLQHHHERADGQKAADPRAQVVTAAHVDELVHQHRAKLVRPKRADQDGRQKDGGPEAPRGERQRILVGLPVQRRQAFSPTRAPASR
jgi:hypothetical protein